MTQIVIRNAVVCVVQGDQSIGSLKSTMLDFFRRGCTSRETYRILDGISLDVQSGETIGVIGNNGAGKSSLLRMLVGIYPPNQGSCVVQGNIVGLLELGAGFNPEYTGLENSVIYLRTLGGDVRASDPIFNDINDFAELGCAFFEPVKNYSSGMIARLAFAVATSVNFDIVVLDEIQAVGDHLFRNKSSNRLKRIIGNSNIVIMASHDLQMIRESCDRIWVLESGRLVFDGDVDSGIEAYLSRSR